jgi:hypothetical protein
MDVRLAAPRRRLLVAWDDLPAQERDLDYSQIVTLPPALARVGRQIRRALAVGVLAQGQLSSEAPSSVRAAIETALIDLLARHRQSAPVLLTRLASPAEMDAAEAARRLGVPYIVVLPMPFELAREDFGRSSAPVTAALGRFFDLIATSERYIELPLRFGSATALTVERTDPATSEGRHARMTRRRQGLLAAAYIVERCDALIAVGGNVAGEQEPASAAIDWWRKGEIPADYATPEVFHARPAMRDREVIVVAGRGM